MKNKVIYFSLLLLTIFIISVTYFSYAFFTHKIEGHGKLNIVAGTLNYKIESSDLQNNQLIVEPNSTKEFNIKITSLNEIDSKYELYYQTETEKSYFEIGYLATEKDSVVGEVKAHHNKEVTIVVRNYSNQRETINFGIEGGFTNQTLALKQGKSIPKWTEDYKESILSGTDPVLTERLIPITLEKNGIVKRANLKEKWYSYREKEWANSVVLKDDSVNYQIGEIIPEENIESYFVWIPKYKYKIFNISNYNSLTKFETEKPPTIEIEFGLNNTSDGNSGECTTPSVAGKIGSCSVGNYMTHPAFQAFGGNGFWVGKFETGYDATKTGENVSESDKIMIKPNVYSWRNITVGNAFQTSYNYLRNLESHMMKNTEWGAVAYLQYSKYGSNSSVRVNNSGWSFITGYGAVEEPTIGYNSGLDILGNHVEDARLNENGIYTKMYNTEEGYQASTTGNITGVYDMSGGAWEYVMGYTIGSNIGEGGASGIKDFDLNFFSDQKWKKYYDSYTSAQTNIQYDDRILGDATGELGPFGQDVDPDTNIRYKSSWYKDCAHFVYASYPWFYRGGLWYDGTSAGIFAFSNFTGEESLYVSFRITLAPIK